MAGDEKSSKMEAWKTKFQASYKDLVKQTNIINKKMMLANQAMNDSDKDPELKVDQQIKDNVRYEMMVRFSMEKHMVSDMMFALSSPLLDKKGDNGEPLKCPKCRGEGEISGERCRTCGGTGKVIDHQMSLNYKMLSAIGDLNRNIYDMTHAAPMGVEKANETIMFAYEQLYNAGLFGKEAEDSLRTVSKGMNIQEEDFKMFVSGYEDFVKNKRAQEAEKLKAKPDAGQEKA